MLRRARPGDKDIAASREVIVRNKLGLHARPAAEFVRHAKSFRCEVWLVKEGQRYSAESLIDVLRANLDCGASVILEARGADAEAAVIRLEELLEKFRKRGED
jgi:phosphocarrier protein HPr